MSVQAATPGGGDWSRRPRPADMPNQWRIFRAKKNGFPPCLVLCDDTTGAYVHYWAGRTRLCLKSCCQACENGQAPRWRGYVAVFCGQTRKFGLLELTPACVPTIERYLESYGTLRGAVFTLSRKGRKDNGEIELVAERKADIAGDLPRSPDVIGHLLRIWRITHEPTKYESHLDATTVASRNGLLARPERK